MKNVKQLVGRGGRLFAVLAFSAAVIAPSLLSGVTVSAASLTNRALSMASTSKGDQTTDANGATLAAGGYGNGAQTRHTFTFNQGTSGATLGSIFLQYCTSPLPGTTCTAPTGMDAATIVTASVTTTGFTANDWTVDTTTNATTASGVNYMATDTNSCAGSGVGRTNCVLLTRVTPSTTAATPLFTINVGTASGWMKNPTAVGPFYVRVVTFSDNTFTTTVDEGAVAGSVNDEVDITARVQEKLNFSVSGTHSAAGASCAALTGGATLNLGDPANNYTLSTSATYYTTNYLRLNTNANSGTTVQYAGKTLETTGGTNTIVSLGATAVSNPPFGTAGFGLQINGADPNVSITNLARQTNYTSDTSFAHDAASTTTPRTIALASAGTTVTCDTVPIRYIGNISTTTKPGIYRSTFTYFATPTF